MPEEIAYTQSDPTTRLRVLERRQETIREKLLVINQNMVEEYKKILGELDAINIDLKDIKQDILALQSTIKKVVQDLDIFARKDEVKVLEKYINMWNPLHFVTEGDVKSLLKKRVSYGKGKRHSRKASR